MTDEQALEEVNKAHAAIVKLEKCKTDVCTVDHYIGDMPVISGKYWFFKSAFKNKFIYKRQN